jgi:4-hydroxy-2-oxoheptanedioate aldolase
MGHLGNPMHPEVQATISGAIKPIRAAGKAGGYLTGNEEEAKKRMAEGFQFVAVGNDLGILARGADALAKKFKG